MDKNEESQAIAKAKAGDRDALGLLWDKTTPKLYGYLVNVTRDKNLAEDLLQQTWLKALNALPDFQERGVGISAWLFAIAKNELRQHWRKGEREVGLDENLHDQAEQAINGTDQKILVEQILNLLSKNEAEIIRLRYISDFSVNDIAKILNINFVTARVRLHRALKKARKILQKL